MNGLRVRVITFLHNNQRSRSLLEVSADYSELRPKISYQYKISKLTNWDMFLLFRL